MNTIQIKKSDLATTLQEALRYAGSTDWGVYVDAQGLLDVRHTTTYDNGSNWHKLINLYKADIENGGKYPNDEDYDYQSSAEWIVNEAGGWLPEYVMILGDNHTESYTKIELID